MLILLPDASDTGNDPLLEPPLPDLELLESLLSLPVLEEPPLSTVPELVVVSLVGSVFSEAEVDVEVEPTSGVTTPAPLDSLVVVNRRVSLLLYHLRQLTSQEWISRVFTSTESL